MGLRLIGLLMVISALAACVSPEATRTRGAAGADVGNRDNILLMHEGSKPFEKTPILIPAQHPPLAPANQADQLSRK